MKPNLYLQLKEALNKSRNSGISILLKSSLTILVLLFIVANIGK